MNLISLIFTIIGTVATISSLIYAYMTNREKAKREQLIQFELAGIAGNISKIRDNPTWADTQFRNIRDNALDIERNEKINLILKYAHDGSRDVTAAERMLGNLLNQVLSLQYGLFLTEHIKHPDIKGI